jgi:CRISPR/Cas system CMR subunit Cmr4 (Cas7 group RAMP superfamily)
MLCPVIMPVRSHTVAVWLMTSHSIIIGFEEHTDSIFQVNMSKVLKAECYVEGVKGNRTLKGRALCNKRESWALKMAATSGQEALLVSRRFIKIFISPNCFSITF